MTNNMDTVIQCQFLLAALRVAQSAGIYLLRGRFRVFFCPAGRHVAPMGWNLARFPIF